MPRRRSPGRVLVVTLLVVTAGYLAWRVAVLAGLEAHFGSGFDEQRFNRLQQEYDRREDAFARADARMRKLVAEHPRAERIDWSRYRTCVREPGRPSDTCTTTPPRDQKVYDALWGVSVILHQRKDEGRTFYRFYHEDPPRYTIMRAPEDTAEEAEEYADAHGFRSTRPLGPGWTILGPIDDISREEKQFP
ncbi:hypothetical protein ACFYP4_28870 [Streptomyces sp. NPDC005551]|uniref:hypothetical protein n=1 Tax=Streptomyces sp. NPDC005551 TaxID=3364725 RepID=UPI003697798C